MIVFSIPADLKAAIASLECFDEKADLLRDLARFIVERRS